MHQEGAARPDQFVRPVPAFIAKLLDLSSRYETRCTAAIANRWWRRSQHGAAAPANQALRVPLAYGFVTRQAYRRQDQVQEGMEHVFECCCVDGADEGVNGRVVPDEVLIADFRRLSQVSQSGRIIESSWSAAAALVHPRILRAFRFAF